MFNPFPFIGQYALQALMLLPALLNMVHEASEAIEAIGGAGTGAAKKQALLEAACAAYDVAERVEPGGLGIDREAFGALSGELVETVLTLKSDVRQLADQHTGA